MTLFVCQISVLVAKFFNLEHPSQSPRDSRVRGSRLNQKRMSDFHTVVQGVAKFFFVIFGLVLVLVDFILHPLLDELSKDQWTKDLHWDTLEHVDRREFDNFDS